MLGEKYGEQVRTLQMGSVSLELCGGTHVSNTSEIGIFSIIGESSPGAGVRRIEAITSTIAVKRLQERSEMLKRIEHLTGVKSEQNVKKIESLLKEVKEQQKKLVRLSKEVGLAKSSDFFANTETLIRDIIFKCASAPEGIDLKELSDRFTNKYKKGILVLYAIKGKKATVLLRSGKELMIDCPRILNAALRPLEGRGGGRKDMAQGSGDADKIHLLEKSLKKILLQSL